MMMVHIVRIDIRSTGKGGVDEDVDVNVDVVVVVVGRDEAAGGSRVTR